MQYREDIDGLRAVAVLLVVFFHFDFEVFSGGYIGVDVFFVISGFLITKIIYRQLESESFSFVEFFFRRQRRLFPAFFVTTAASTIVAILVLNPEDLASFGASVISALLFSSNIYFFFKSGYFDETTPKPMLHTWSLAVEEQFYFVFPIVLFLVYPALRVLSNKSRFFYAIAACFVAFLLGELILNVNREFSFYMLPSRLGEFLIGACVALIRFPRFSRSVTDLLWIIGMIMILGPAISLNSYSRFPGFSALLPCLGTATLIVVGSKSTFRLVLTSRIARILGKSSYSIYLIHWPAVMFYKYI